MAERIVELVRPIAKMPLLPGENSKKRVAAYARVSTDSDEQMGSVKAQKTISKSSFIVIPNGYLPVYMQTRAFPAPHSIAGKHSIK